VSANLHLLARRFAACAALAAAAALPAAAELCWEYTDLELAKVPLKCVEQGDLTTGCFFDENCNLDLDPSDCCIAVYDPLVTQTIGEMHLKWHQCLGSTGPTVSPPPPNRGLRWMAFHRQFEWDFNVYREANGFGKIDALEWCPGIVMPYGHYGADDPFPPHPLGCGTGPNRPDGTTCDFCTPFSPCLYLDGAGPAACPAGPPTCSSGGVSFPSYDSLEDFQNADEIAHILDATFHGDMHGQVAFADGGGYNADCGDPNCSPRDPMFWRLHKALDEVIRAWQNVKAVDVTLVIDRSGSMAAASGTGVGTRLENAVEAADMFGDLLEEGRSDGAVNRIGIVSYSTNAANAVLNMPLQDVTTSLRDIGGPFDTVLTALVASGSTSIGAGVVGAIDQLCPGGDCSTYVPAPGENQRKAILLLTDGQENTAPCLEAGCQFGVPGGEIDYDTLSLTQACAVGLGNASAVNGELLTLFAERQGGIYINDTDSTGDDLKDFFTKCFAELTDEFVGLDPAGTLAAAEPAGPIVPFESCDDKRLTFTAGWTRSSLLGDHLRFLVTSPAGNAWVPAAGYGEQSTEDSWAFKRCPLPYGIEGPGIWNMQLLRPQRAFANGFTSDSFVDLAKGTRLVRRQVQRLCPIDDKGERSCKRVLLYEDGVRGSSAYAEALRTETGVTVDAPVTATSAADFDRRLGENGWDLIVYAHQAGADAREVYDARLADQICSGTRAIVTDTRSVAEAAAILRCAGATRVPSVVNLKTLVGGEKFVAETAQLANPGYPVFSYGLAPAASGGAAVSLDATFAGGAGGSGAIAGRALAGGPLNWHKNVLVTGLSKLTAFPPRSVLHTGDPIKAAVRILQPFNRKGGYPGARMTVEVTRPTIGFGSLVKQVDKAQPVAGDPISGLEQQLGKVRIPTRSETYDLHDSGKYGDEIARNGTFSADLPISAAVDGMYTYHFRFAYPAGSCTAHRELKHSLFVEVKVDPGASQVQVGTPTQASGGGKIYPVRMQPRDLLGNVVGPGRKAKPSCAEPCACDAKNVVDHNNGAYTIPVLAPAGVELRSCTLDAFGAEFTFR
jgi:hypothetical protein